MDKEEIKRFIDSGYCLISLKHGIVARIDRPDWKEFMASKHQPSNPEEGLKWVSLLGNRAADHYRRVYSQDTLELGKNNGKEFPRSALSSLEYQEKVS